MNITIHGHTISVSGEDHAKRLSARAEAFRDQDDQDGLEKWLYAGAPLGLTPDQIAEAAEIGTNWGQQEAELQLEAVENSHQRTTPEWTMGNWCGANPFDRIDATADLANEYETVLDRAAKPSAAPMIAAIKAGIAADGDEQDWHAPEFEDIRRLTGAAGMQWAFDGWAHALRCLEGGKLGGVEVSK